MSFWIWKCGFLRFYRNTFMLRLSNSTGLNWKKYYSIDPNQHVRAHTQFPVRDGSVLFCINSFWVDPCVRVHRIDGREAVLDRVGRCLGEKQCTLTTNCVVTTTSMYCAYPVSGMGSNSLMYYYNGKTVRRFPFCSDTFQNLWWVWESR